MDLNTGYLVELSGGSYDDFRTKPLRVYLKEEEAKKYIDKYNVLLPKLIKFYNDWCENNPYDDKENDWHGWGFHEKKNSIYEIWPATILNIEII